MTLNAEHDLSMKRGYLNEEFQIFHIKDQENIEIDYHHHDFNKIILFISGEVSYIIEGKCYRLKPWDMLFISNNQIHKPLISSSKIYDRIVIWVNPEFMLKNNDKTCNLLTCFQLASENEYSLLRPNLQWRDYISNMIFRIKDTNDNEKLFGSSLLKSILFLELMIMLNRLFLENDKDKNLKDIDYDETIEGILAYINANLHKSLSIEQIASDFYMSKYYLMHKFKSSTGQSLYNYIIHKRIILAKSLIRKGLSMGDVCVSCGFEDYSAFVRAFKKIVGVSPKNYHGNYLSASHPLE